MPSSADAGNAAEIILDSSRELRDSRGIFLRNKDAVFAAGPVVVANRQDAPVGPENLLCFLKLLP